MQLVDVGNLALDQGLDLDSALAVMAIAQTEGGLDGQVGDHGQSYSWLQLHSGGQLKNFAADLGVSLAEAAQVATSNPELVGQWALSPRGTNGWKSNGYLGDTLRRGQQLGLHGAELAQFGQHYGQVSVSPERAAQNFSYLFGDFQAPADAGWGAVAAGATGFGDTSSGGRQRAERPSQFSLGLSPQDAAAFCGPINVMTFLATYGRTPTVSEAKQMASQLGWNNQRGMAGPQSWAQMATNFGVPTTFDPSLDWNKGRQVLAQNHPLVISTTGHYFYADDYDPTNDAYHVGTSGTDLARGGSEWMTPAQMSASMGSINGLLWANESQGGGVGAGGGDDERDTSAGARWASYQSASSRAGGMFSRPNEFQPPGTSSDAIANQYYTRKTLGDAGWKQDAIDAAQQIPVDYLKHGDAWEAANGGVYGMTKGSGNPWTYMSVDTDYGGGNDRALSQALEHEMMHAWAGAANSNSNAIPPAIRKQDYERVQRELPRLNNSPDSYRTWRSIPGAPANYQVDENHYPQSLFNQGYNPSDIPAWYRDKYLSEYGSGGGDDDDVHPPKGFESLDYIGRHSMRPTYEARSDAPGDPRWAPNGAEHIYREYRPEWAPRFRQEPFIPSEFLPYIDQNPGGATPWQ